jgi:hypothetical protein
MLEIIISNLGHRRTLCPVECLASAAARPVRFQVFVLALNRDLTLLAESAEDVSNGLRSDRRRDNFISI